MRSVPIRVRVAGAFALAMAIVLVGGSWFVYSSLSSHLSTALDHDLRLRAEDLRALVREGNASLATTSEPRFIESGEAYAQLVDIHGRVVDGTKPLGRVSLLTPAQLRHARREQMFGDRPSVPGLDEPSRFLASPVERAGKRAGKPFVLVVGATLGDRSDALSNLRDGLVLAVPLALLLATLSGYLLAGVALRPVEAMRSRAASITADAAGERLPVPATGDELERLGKTLNSLLARLEAALERERGFVADAAHELRTPLALLRTELELALRHGETAAELREAIRASSEEAERLAQLAEDLLLFARADRGELGLRAEEIEVASLFSSLQTRFEWRAAEAGREIRSSAPAGACVAGDRPRLEQALGNLIDNALRYGSGDVQLEATPEPDDRIALHVRDDGDGFSDDFLPHAFERFSRASPSRGETGAGLGLAIVQTIAQAHGGVAVAANRGGGGADVSITLPATAAAREETDVEKATRVV